MIHGVKSSWRTASGRVLDGIRYFDSSAEAGAYMAGLKEAEEFFRDGESDMEVYMIYPEYDGEDKLRAEIHQIGLTNRPPFSATVPPGREPQ